MNNSEKLAKIDVILNSVPSFSCKDGCANCCGPIEMSRLEYFRVVKASGRSSEDIKKQMQSNLKQGNFRCPLLHPKTNHCTVYEVRPAICRLFGVVKDRMQCPHGCAPDVSMQLDDQHSRQILAQVEELGR